MNFLNTPALLYLLAIPPVVLLYFLRLRRKDRRVPSTLLWETSTADLQANTPFQRLRKSLVLFLQILLLAVLAFLIARPFLRVHALRGESLVIVIDASASMQATDVRPSRIDAAKQAAGKIVADLSKGDEACVIEAGRRTRVRASFTSNHRLLAGAIGKAQATDTETALRDAMALAVSLAKKKREAEIVLISDGAFEPLDDLALGGERVRFVRIGKGSRNVGITAMDARRDYSERGALQVFVQIASFAPEATSFVLEMYHNDSLIDARPVELAPGGTHGEVFAGFPFEAGVVRAHIDLQDELAVDNTAYAYLVPPNELTVRLVGEESLFLQRALEVDPRVHVSHVAVGDYRPDLQADVTIFNGWAPDKLADGGSLLINASARNGPVEVTGKAPTPTVVRWDEKHPVMRYVSFEQVAIAEALTVSPRPWGQVLVEGGTTPLVVAGQQGKLRVVYVGFQLERSNLPLRAAFPILVQNCLVWLATGSEAVANRSIRTGEAMQLAAPPSAEGLTVRGPDGTTYKLGTESGRVSFDATERAGVYRATSSAGQFLFVANLLSAPESNVKPRSEINLGGRRVGGGSALVTSNREIWRHLAVIALLILALEWYAYHRRI
jgi:Ca-activated chloride channel family protein